MSYLKKLNKIADDLDTSNYQTDHLPLQQQEQESFWKIQG